MALPFSRSGSGGNNAFGRLGPGDRTPQHRFKPLQGEEIDITSLERPVHLQFRRFAGCPICQLHLRSFVQRADELRGKVHEIVLFHSTEKELSKYVSDFPFPLVADPNKQLYKAFRVETSPLALMAVADIRRWRTVANMARATLPDVLRGHRPPPPLLPKGGHLGLPADFLVFPDGGVHAAHYGRHADDQWSVDDLLQLVRTSDSDAA